MTIKKAGDAKFPPVTGLRCLMMPFIQGDPESVPDTYHPYRDILAQAFVRRGDVGFLTIDESPVTAGKPHRGDRAQHDRALHTEAGLHPSGYCWGYHPTSRPSVTLERDVRILLANSLSGTCAVWNREHADTSLDGDIGHAADRYPYAEAVFLQEGELYEIGILTPHESLPVAHDGVRQFLRIVSSGVHGREPYFTENPLCPAP